MMETIKNEMSDGYEDKEGDFANLKVGNHIVEVPGKHGGKFLNAQCDGQLLSECSFEDVETIALMHYRFSSVPPGADGMSMTYYMGANDARALATNLLILADKLDGGKKN